MHNSENKQLTREERKQIKEKIRRIIKPLWTYCPYGIRLAATTRQKDWWYVQKANWCADLVELHAQIGEEQLSKSRYSDLVLLVSKNRAALQAIKKTGKFPQLVEKMEMSDLTNQPLSVQIERIQEFTEYDDDEKFAAEMPCSVTTVKAWKSGKVSQPTIGYRKAVQALAARAMCTWPFVKALRAEAESDCAYKAPPQSHITLGKGGPVSPEDYAAPFCPKTERVIPPPSIH